MAIAVAVAEQSSKVAHDDAVMDEEAADVHAGRRVQSDEIVISRKVGKGRELRVGSLRTAGALEGRCVGCVCVCVCLCACVRV